MSATPEPSSRPAPRAVVPPALTRARFPRPVIEVLRTLDEVGHRSWIVGGAVRDLLLHRPRAATDVDIATPARPEQVMGLFPKVVPTGIEHGTVTVLSDGSKIEVTTFRGEGEYVDGRRPSWVEFHTSLDDDLARRDFTVNALAYDPVGREFRDPFGGREDIRRRVLRAVGDPAERFAEDGLRPIRAMRFAAQLGYRLERRTLAAIPGALAAVRKVSRERIAEEMLRLVVAARAGDALLLMRITGLLAEVLPVFGSLGASAQRHAIRVTARVEAEPARRFAALLHPASADEVARSLVALRIPGRIAAEAGALVAAHVCARTARRMVGPAEDDRSTRRWLSAVGPERAAALLDLRLADARDLPPSRARAETARARRLRARANRVMRARPPLAIADLALDGRAVMRLLGAPPGPEVGQALRHLLDRVLDDPRLNTRDALARELRIWSDRRKSPQR